MAKKEQYMVVGRPSTSLKEEVWTTCATNRVEAANNIVKMRERRDGINFLVDFVFTPAQMCESDFRQRR